MPGCQGKSLLALVLDPLPVISGEILPLDFDNRAIAFFQMHGVANRFQELRLDLALTINAGPGTPFGCFNFCLLFGLLFLSGLVLLTPFFSLFALFLSLLLELVGFLFC